MPVSSRTGQTELVDPVLDLCEQTLVAHHPEVTAAQADLGKLLGANLPPQSDQLYRRDIGRCRPLGRLFRPVDAIERSPPSDPCDSPPSKGVE
jgi:hypothetical protein